MGIVEPAGRRGLAGWVWGQAGGEGSVQSCLAHKGSLLWVMGLPWQLYLLSVAFIKVSSFRPSNLQPLCVLPPGPAPIPWLDDSEGPPCSVSRAPATPPNPATSLPPSPPRERSERLCTQGEHLSPGPSTPRNGPKSPRRYDWCWGWGIEAAWAECTRSGTHACTYVYPCVSLRAVHPSVPSARVFTQTHTGMSTV